MSLIVARRYARALNEDAAQKNAVTQVDEDVSMIQESLIGSPELRRFFADPMINSDKKGTVIRSLFEKKVHKITFAFLQLLAKKRREDILPDILQPIATFGMNNWVSLKLRYVLPFPWMLTKKPG